jgi:RNA recognition motif-containing protein
MNLFVSNLPYDVTDVDLKEIFSDFGLVNSARICRDRYSGKSRGFGFICMNDYTAKLAITALNGFQLDGKKLSVSVARERENINRYGDRTTKPVFNDYYNNKY